MKKIVIMMFALVAIISCGNKTNGAASDADSAVVNEVPDTLNTIEAVEKQVDAVYEYWNELRTHHDESEPTLDERFGSKEWQRGRRGTAGSLALRLLRGYRQCRQYSGQDASQRHG